MKKAIVNFKIGRGGRFHNQGHLSCDGVGKSLAHYVEESNFIYPEHYQDVLKQIEQREDEDGNTIYDMDDVRSDLFDGILSHDDFCNKYGLEIGALGDDYLFDGNGNGIGALPDEEGNYHYDIDGDYETHYGKAIDSFNDLSEREQQCLSGYDLEQMAIYGVEDLPTDEDEDDTEDED